MKQLFKIAFGNHKHRFLIGLTIFAMCLLTFASQLEIFALSVITKKGPDFFELFAPVKDGKLQKSDAITKADIDERWAQIDGEKNGSITKEDAVRYISKWKHSDVIENALGKLNQIFPITGNLLNLAIMLVVVAIFKAITLFTHRYSTRLVAIRVSRDLRQAYFTHIQSLPMSFYQQHNIGGLSSRVVGDAALIAEAINACLVNYMQTPFTVISTLTLCFLTSWQLSLIIFFGFPLIIYPIFFLARRVKRISQQIQQNQENFASVLIDFLAGIQTVKVFAMEDFSLKKISRSKSTHGGLRAKECPL